MHMAEVQAAASRGPMWHRESKPLGTNFETKIFKFWWFLGPSDQNELYHTPLLSKIWDLNDRQKIVNNPFKTILLCIWWPAGAGKSFKCIFCITTDFKQHSYVTRPCTTVRDSEDILEQSPFQKYTTCWVFLALYFAFAHLTHGSIIFDTLEQSSFQKYTTYWVFLVLHHMLYLCICIFVFACLINGNIIFDILEQSSFQKYTTCWVFLVLCHVLYLCICVFVCLYLCICVLDTWQYQFWYPWIKCFQKIYGLYGLNHHTVEILWRCYQGGTTNQPTDQPNNGRQSYSVNLSLAIKF